MQYFKGVLIFLILFFLFNSYLFAQHTFVHTDNGKLFRLGEELLGKKQYASAQATFQEYLQTFNPYQENQPEMSIEAQYYVAFCALKLADTDADALLENFVNAYPTHPKAATAYLDWGNQYYANQDYDKAIDYFIKVPTQNLPQDIQDETHYRLALAYFQKKNYNLAEKYFNELKEGINVFADASAYYAGFIAYQENRLDIALRDFEKASRSKEYASLTPIFISHIYYQQKKYPTLIQYATPFLQKNQDIDKIKDIYLLTADAHFFEKNYAQATQYYKAHIGLATTKPNKEVSYRLGYSLFQLKEYQQAIDWLKNTADEKTKQGQYAAYYLALAYMQINNKPFAATAFEQAKNTKFDVEIEQEATWNLAKLLFELERFDESIQNLKTFIANFPKHPARNQSYDLLSKAYLYSNQYDEAIAYLDNIENKTPAIRSAYQQITFSKGTEAFNNGNYKTAVQFFQKSLQNPQIASITIAGKFWLAESHLLNENPRAAIPLYQELLDLDVTDNTFTLQAHYGLGYAFYNTEQYAAATPHFQVFVSRRPENRKSLEDAMMRLADCYYAQRDYTNALRYYNQSIDLNYADKDYASYQKGVISNITNQPEQAKNAFDLVINNFPNSIYYDASLYQKGLIDLEKGSFAVAVSGFSKLIQDRPNSSLVPDALMKRALAYNNIGNKNSAIEDYKRIINDFTTNPRATDAIYGLQELLSVQGRDAEFPPLLAKFKQANPNSQTSEKIYFENAKNLYFNQQYDVAIKAFSDYISSFPKSPFVSDATYYLAEAYYRLNDWENALQYHQIVVKEQKSAFLLRSARRAGELEFHKKQFKNAVNYYRIVATNADNKRDQNAAFVGLMECYYQLAKYDSLNYYADQILNQTDVSGARNTALLYKGKINYAQQQYTVALPLFKELAQKTSDEVGAEAQYLLGDIYYKQRLHKQSLEILFELNKKFSAYEKWRGKAFLLVADNYIAMGETFQAKATLQSLIDKSPDKEVVEQARVKLNSLQ